MTDHMPSGGARSSHRKGPSQVDETTYALKSASTDLCGGYQATGIPTATAQERDTEENRKRREEFLEKIRRTCFSDPPGTASSFNNCNGLPHRIRR